MDLFRTSRWRLLPALAALLLVPGLAVPGPAAGAGGTAGPGSLYPYRLLAKAQPDECFNGIGAPYPPGPPCATGKPKVNQSYVWGLTQVHDHVWFGTGANVQCLVDGATLGSVKSVVNDDYTCELGEGQYAKQHPNEPADVGDMRPPEVFYYDTRKGRLVAKSADIDNASPDDANRRKATVGLRAAGAFHGVVLLGGPALGNALNLFAFDGDSGNYLGSTTLPEYGNIRHFFVARDALYAGVGVGRNGAGSGHVLRWTGSRGNPFSFEDVADLPTQAADLTLFQNRIFISTWPTAAANSPQTTAGIWMSPPLSDRKQHLDAGDATGWTQVWNAGQYEPDPFMAATYGMGGLAAYNGYLYWGTMHVPLNATVAFEKLYPQASGDPTSAAIKNTQRAAAIFRGRDFGGTHQQVDLLYGESQLPSYDPKANNGTGSWSMRPTGYTPRYGASGFGNKFNNYEWVMTVADGRLFVGTMDWSYIAKNLVPPDQGSIDPSTYGGELWMFGCGDRPATAVDTTGVGNYLNYGVRNMIADGSTLYLGMANPMNLRTDPNDGIPLGGWELIKMDVADHR